MREEHRYDDIILLPHPTSRSHPRMPLEDRAAQFSPFAALTGHEAAIRETARLTDRWAEPAEDEREYLDLQLCRIRTALSRRPDGVPAGEDDEDRLPEAVFTYFQPDERKEGGRYVTVKGRVKKIDENARKVILADGSALDTDRLCAVTDIRLRHARS